MPFPTGYALTARDWNEVIEVLRLQAIDDGIDANDFPAMLELMRTGFVILSDNALRERFLNNRGRVDLAAKETATDTQLTNIRGQIGRLPPDPGPIPPR